MTVQAFSTLVFRLMTELEEVHSHWLEHRLCNFLLLHASADGTLQLTQQEIASHLGTTREVVARALGQLAAEGGFERPPPDRHQRPGQAGREYRPEGAVGTRRMTD
jgi:CRP-like cAMP-binding protein